MRVRVWDVKYNPQVLQSFADDLYARADWIVIKTILLFALVAFVLALIGLNSLPTSLIPSDSNTVLLSAVPALLAGLLGWSVGATKAFQLRLQAQQILCQKQIEENTRLTTP